MWSLKCGTGPQARTQPVRFGRIQYQVFAWSFGNINRGVPTDITTVECGGSGFAVACEDPLLTVFALEVPNVDVRFLAVDDWWGAAGCGAVVKDPSRWFRHRFVSSTTFCVGY